MRNLLAFLALAAATLSCAQSNTVTVGSKKFTESYVLGEMARKVLADAGFSAIHKQGMGGTIILWEALKGGSIDVYPEYTGTITEEILKLKGQKLSDDGLRKALAQFGIGMTDELGFNNTYALAMTQAKAKSLGITKISDLRGHPELKVGVNHEFLDRQDGWKPLAATYGLHMTDVKGIDHAIGYEALAKGDTDIIDAYSTDAKIAENHLVVLEDDLGFFPKYQAVYLYRLSLAPKAVKALGTLTHTLDEIKMTGLNAAAEESKNYSAAAADYFKKYYKAATPSAAATSSEGQSMWQAMGRETAQHLKLVTLSMVFAILVGIPLGIFAWRPGFAGTAILSIVGVIQTIPSLALLAFLVPVMGIQPKTAIVALFLYSLLPIVRNTATGLQEIPPSLREAAAALGLPPAARLFRVFLPMASRSILAGIKTSAVINVGTATLAALIGAGGLGEPILSGLNLNDTATILQGAIPAALLAVLVQLLIDGLDLILIPRGLRLPRSTY